MDTPTIDTHIVSPILPNSANFDTHGLVLPPWKVARLVNQLIAQIRVDFPTRKIVKVRFNDRPALQAEKAKWMGDRILIQGYPNHIEAVMITETGNHKIGTGVGGMITYYVWFSQIAEIQNNNPPE